MFGIGGKKWYFCGFIILLLIMRRLLVLALLMLPVISSAQHALQLDNGTYYGLINASLLTANRTYSLPDFDGVLVTEGSLGNLVWMLGGNTASAPNNQLGTLDADDLNIITGGLANTRMVIDGTTGFVGIGTTPAGTYPLNIEHINTTAIPPAIGTNITYELQPSGVIAAGTLDALHVNANVTNSAFNIAGVLDGIRTVVSTDATYTGTLGYAQGHNGNIEHNALSTLPNADASIGSVYNQGAGAANIITNARGAAGQVWNSGTGSIVNAYGHWSRLVNFSTGSMTNAFNYYSDLFSYNGGNIANAYLFYGTNAGLSAGGTITNLTGLYLQQLTAGTTNTAIRYAHTTRPFVVTGNSEVSIGNATPTAGIPLSLYPGSGGSTILRLHRTAAGQYLASEYQPDGVLSATNPRWGTGLMGGAFQNGNYAIWSTDGVTDVPRLSIDFDGEIGMGIEPVGGALDSRLTVASTLTIPYGIPTNNARFIHTLTPNAPNADEINNLRVISNISGANNLSGVVDLARGDLITDAAYTGILGYAQGFNGNITHNALSTLPNADAIIGTVVNNGAAAANIMTNARGAAGQVWNQGIGSIGNAFGHWSRLANLTTGSITSAFGYYSDSYSWGGGNINNLYLFFGASPNLAGGGTVTTLTGLYLQQLTAATTNRAIHYAHGARPFVVMGGGEVSIGNANPTTGITLSLYPGSIGSTIQRLHRTAAGQYLSTDYQPNGALSATNPRWGTGLMGGGFQNGNYAIWRTDGAIDIPTLSMDYDGEIGAGIEPVGGTHNGKFTIQQDITTPLAVTTNNTRLIQNLTPNAVTAQEYNNLYMRTNISNTASNMTNIADLIRGELVIASTYTGTLNYAQGGNFVVQHDAPTTLANVDGVLGTVYSFNGASATNNITNARGVVGQVQTVSAGTITNAYGFWGRIEDVGAGSITNGYLFYGNNPDAAAPTNITGFYQAELTGGTVRRAFHYDHATSPFVVDGAGDVGVGTETLAGDKLTVLSTGLGTLSTTSSTTDEEYAIRGEVTGDAASHVVGVWGDASNASITNTESIAMLATGNGNANAGETNIALQVADGELTMGRTSEVGAGYTVINPSADGTDYSEEGPTGSIQFDLSTVTFNNNNNMVSNETRVSDAITINNRYARNGSIIMFTINDKVDEGTAPNPINVAFTINCINRNNGNFVIRIYATSRNNLAGSGTPFQAGDLLRVGYMIVNPSR
jgi:hypothetical protein